MPFSPGHSSVREDFLEEARLSKEKQVTPGGRAEQAEFRRWGDMNGGGGQLSLVAARGPPAGQRGSVHFFWRLIPVFTFQS